MSSEVMAIATVFSAATSYQQQRQAGSAEAQMHAQNAVIAEQEAESVKKTSEHDERTMRVEGRKLKAQQLLQFAKGGVVPTTGTPLLVRQETGAEIEKEVKKRKYGYGLQYSRAMQESRLQKLMGGAKTRAARYAAGTSLLTGAYRLASIYR